MTDQAKPTAEDVERARQFLHIPENIHANVQHWSTTVEEVAALIAEVREETRAELGFAQGDLPHCSRCGVVLNCGGSDKEHESALRAEVANAKAEMVKRGGAPDEGCNDEIELAQEAYEAGRRAEAVRWATVLAPGVEPPETDPEVHCEAHRLSAEAEFERGRKAGREEATSYCGGEEMTNEKADVG